MQTYSPIKSALVTGGAQRIGRELALALAQSGYNIALHYQHSYDQAQAVLKEIKALGRECRLFNADLSQHLAVTNIIKTVFQSFPDCSLLVNNASIFERASLQETTEDSFDRHMAINFKAPFFLTQQFAQHCKQGQVVNMCDTYIEKDSSPYAAYLLSKKSLVELTRMAAREFGPNIRVNAICPGIVLPPEPLPQAFIDTKLATLPLRKFPEVKDIVSALQWLVTAESTTGQCIFIDGGEHLL